MKKILISIAILFATITGNSQAISTGNSAMNQRTEDFRPNSPTNMDGNRKILGWRKDSISFVMLQDTVRLGSLSGTGSRVVVANPNGSLTTSNAYLLSSVAASTYQLNLGFTPYNSTNPAGYISSYSETDPIWSGVASGYRTKIQNDLLYQAIGSYLTSESDPVWTGVSSNYRTKIQNDALYQVVGSYLTSEVDPIYTANIGNYFTKTQSDARYLQSFTELDPTVPAYSKSLTAFSVIKTSTDALYQAIGTYLSPTGNGSGLTGLTKAQVGLSNVDNTTDLGKPLSTATITALSGKFSTPSGTTSQYIKGDGSLATFPTIKKQETYSSVTNASGIYAVTFPVAYSVAPNIQANIIGGSNKMTQLTTVTTTGFSIYVQVRADVLGLLPSYSNVNAQALDVLITEK